MKRATINAESFETLRERDRAQADVLYAVREKDGGYSYGVSPDGVGFVWYDTAEEAIYEHG